MTEPSGDGAGVSIFIKRIVEYFDQSIFETHYAVPQENSFTNSLKDFNVTAIKFPSDYQNPFQFSNTLWQFYKLIKKERYDIICSHTLKSGFSIALVTLFTGTHFTYTQHGWRFAQKKNIFTKVIFFLLDFFVCWRASIVFMESIDSQLISEKFNLAKKEKSVLSRYSLDMPKRNEFLSKNHFLDLCNFQNDTLVIGMIGRIADQKDPYTFVKTAQEICKEFDKARFVWIGDGEMRKEIEDYVKKLNLESKIYFAGYKKHEDIISWIDFIDIVLFTSKFEGLPLVLLEEMSAGKIIVAAEVNGIPDAIKNGETGFLFKPGDVKQAVKHLQLLQNMTPEEKNRLSKNALNYFIENHFPANKLSEIVASTILKLVTTKPLPAGNPRKVT